ncbi:MAG: Ldh family oxidoreductase [Candidatus Thiodiazotropha sp. L084R]
MTEASPTKEKVEIPLADVKSICRDALNGFISPVSVVDEVLSQLLDAELRGKQSHGLVRIPWLKKRLKRIEHQAAIKQEISPWFSRFECSKSIGYVAAREATEDLQRILADQPFGISVCASAFPTGVIGNYLSDLSSSGYIAMGIATSPALVSLAPGEKPLLGTNPIALALPAFENKPAFIADISPAPATFGQLLSMLFGNEGDLEELSVLNGDGQQPSEAGEMFDDQIRLVGQIVQQFNTSAQRRSYALTIAIQLLTILFAGDSPRGALVLMALDPKRIPGLHLTETINFLEKMTQRGATVPGAHGEAHLNKQYQKGTLSLPVPLWHAIQSLASACN